jgi:hypothetical protein
MIYQFLRLQVVSTTSKSPPNKALQTDKGKLSSFCIRKSHVILPLPLSVFVRRPKVRRAGW